LKLASLLPRCWYSGCSLRFLLAPLAALFFLAVVLRRMAYRSGVLMTVILPVPVIVVGNITAGGTGKTPLTLKLVEWLREAGYRPGVVSRGYGGRDAGVQAVVRDSDPAGCGDEPVLIAKRAGCPVWIGRQRAEAARQMLANHPEVDVVIADDGLQHYALGRDVEVAVVDGKRGFGNGWPLPAGPLREPRSRLDRVDAVVVNGGVAEVLHMTAPVFAMQLVSAGLRGVRDPLRQARPDDLLGQRVQALAGIGNPERFFDQLRRLGLDAAPHVFPDHHDYTPSDLPAGTLVMTEKDAVKCAAFAPDDAWYLMVDAEVEAGLKELVLDRLKEIHGRKTA